MSKVLIIIGVAGIAAAACGPQPASTNAGATGGEMPVAVTLPAGDANAGRQAFLDLKCTACHTVPSETDFPAPVSANPGPPIDARLSTRDLSYVVTAVVSPSHELSPEMDPQVREQLTGVLSPMGDFSHSMTVRQLVDLQAFLRSVG
jgi:hypothetical protein